MTRTVPVMLPIPADHPYTYAVCPQMQLSPGDIVRVPLGSRQTVGVVWENSHNQKNTKSTRVRLKEVSKKYDCPSLQINMRRFIEWVANYVICPPGMVLRMTLNSPGAYAAPALQKELLYTNVEPGRMTSARECILKLAKENGPWRKSDLASAAEVGVSVVEGLIKTGSLKEVLTPPRPFVGKPDPDFLKPKLSQKQSEAAGKLIDTIREASTSVTLLDGVTGSGKTEVYFEAMAETFRKGKQVLILLPEIALTSQPPERFKKRFGEYPVQWHSDISQKIREKVWRQIATGEIHAVFGARSALYLPFRELGLIIVDEEHETAFKQEDRVFHNARDMAVVRGTMESVPVILSSATPSIESRVNANAGRYRYIRLEERYKQAALPDVQIIDMRKFSPEYGKFLSPILIEEISRTLERKEQALVFLNRRGYAPLILCRACGHRWRCNDCSAWLVEHRLRKRLVCHHCGHEEPVPGSCPDCGEKDCFVSCGPGVERIGEEIAQIFPDRRVIILSSDMTDGAKRMRMELNMIARGEVDIIVGTQLAAKGHNFPLITCVGVVDADLGLANVDPHAAEQTFQLLCQVIGRAGRDGRKSAGLIQTFQPEHPVITALASGKREQFYEREIAARKTAGLPPFSRLASMIISSTSRQKAEAYANAVRLTCRQNNAVLTLGPAQAPLAQIRGRYRYRLLFRADRASRLRSYIRDILANKPGITGDIRLQIDVDPKNFL